MRPGPSCRSTPCSGATVNAAQAVGGLAADKVGAVKTAAIASLPQQGVLYHGLEVMGGGSILAGLILGAIGVFVIERDFVKASAFALAGAVLTYFGFMHGEAVGVGGGYGVTPGVALAYAVMAAGFFAVGKYGTSTSYVPQHDHADRGAGRVTRWRDWRDGRRRNRRRASYFTSIFACSATSFQTAISCLMKSANASGELPTTWMAWLSSRDSGFRIFQRLHDLGVQPGDDRRRRFGRRQDSVPADRVEARIAAFGNRRHVGRHR